MLTPGSQWVQNLMMDNQLRYSSHTRLEDFGEQSQNTLLKSSVLIIGAGGLGSIASIYLTTSGIGQITVVDFDTIDESNLPRQILFKADDLGKNKALITKKRLIEYNSEAIINSIDKKLSEDEMNKVISHVDIVIDATDDLESRLMINKICYNLKKPLIVGAAIRYEGHVLKLNNTKDNNSCLNCLYSSSDENLENCVINKICYNLKKPLIVGAAIRYEGHVLKLNNTKDNNSCLNCLYSSSDENLENCEGNGIMSPVAGMIGSMMANECIKTLIGINNNKENTISIFDLKNNIYQKINIPKNMKCSVCS